MVNLIYDGISLRVRLLRKFFYRAWKNFVIAKAKKYIVAAQCGATDSRDVSGPAVILCNLKHIRDIHVLMYLFREKEFGFVGLRVLEKVSVFKRLASFNRVIFFDPRKKAYSFLKEILVSLRNFNRTIILFPKIELDIPKEYVIDPSAVVRIAMMASVPIVPVSITWTDLRAPKCNVVVGKRFFVSPASSEFRDVFFRRKGMRKFSRLDREELMAVAERIFSKLELADGPNLS